MNDFLNDIFLDKFLISLIRKWIIFSSSVLLKCEIFSVCLLRYDSFFLQKNLIFNALSWNDITMPASKGESMCIEMFYRQPDLHKSTLCMRRNTINRSFCELFFFFFVLLLKQIFKKKFLRTFEAPGVNYNFVFYTVG